MRRPLLFLSLAVACTSQPPWEHDAVRAAIQHELDLGAEATMREDIEAYMALVPADWVLKDESGELVTRERQRANVLRDWAIIDRTLVLRSSVDSLRGAADSATVYTSQYWKRLMFQRDGRTIDTVVTTQNHRETWRRRNGRWMGYDIDELGGTIMVNGRPWP